jgi:hypothetical protein
LIIKRKPAAGSIHGDQAQLLKQRNSDGISACISLLKVEETLPYTAEAAPTPPILLTKRQTRSLDIVYPELALNPSKDEAERLGMTLV